LKVPGRSRGLRRHPSQKPPSGGFFYGHAPFTPDVYAGAMIKLLIRWSLLAAALLAISHLYSGVMVQSFSAALLVALVLGLLNAIVRPVLVVLTLPATVLTLGLFLFVINAAMVYTASWMLQGFQVRDFGAALLASLLYSLAGVVIDAALQHLFHRE
jgi:putative membrane protein